ncbi:hypothetical protein [Campylobacter cuniculorum]|uniref:Radical SAM protein n=1 Tax=Campylobacter cuniculorum TaxID=374106 RepID=A0ABX6TWN1_9BACT|nr:hypothetical protein [Campylobacter cuniculorum]QOR04224.1 hypothetical protein A0071_08700 [Campylobacter cuniculorum]
MFEENLSYVTQKVLEGGKCKTLQDCEKFPRFINLETINNCTARCVMCGIDEWRKNITQPYMKDELFFKIADEIIENKNSVQKVALFVGNEPFLDQNLPQRVKYLTGGGLK